MASPMDALDRIERPRRHARMGSNRDTFRFHQAEVTACLYAGSADAR